MIDFSKYNVRIDYAKNIYVIEDFKTKGGRRNKKGGSSPPCCNSTTRIMNTTHTNSTTKKELAFGIGGGADAQLAISYAKNYNCEAGVACYTRRGYWEHIKLILYDNNDANKKLISKYINSLLKFKNTDNNYINNKFNNTDDAVLDNPNVDNNFDDHPSELCYSLSRNDIMSNKDVIIYMFLILYLTAIDTVRTMVKWDKTLQDTLPKIYKSFENNDDLKFLFKTKKNSETTSCLCFNNNNLIAKKYFKNDKNVIDATYYKYDVKCNVFTMDYTKPLDVNMNDNEFSDLLIYMNKILDKIGLRHKTLFEDISIVSKLMKENESITMIPILMYKDIELLNPSGVPHNYTTVYSENFMKHPTDDSKCTIKNKINKFDKYAIKSFNQFTKLVALDAGGDVLTYFDVENSSSEFNWDNENIERDSKSLYLMKKSGKPVDLFIVGLGVDGQFTHDFLLDKLKNLTYKIYAKSEIQDFYNIYKQDALALKLEIYRTPSIFLYLNGDDDGNKDSVNVKVGYESTPTVDGFNYRICQRTDMNPLIMIAVNSPFVCCNKSNTLSRNYRNDRNDKQKKLVNKIRDYVYTNKIIRWQNDDTDVPENDKLDNIMSKFPYYNSFSDGYDYRESLLKLAISNKSIFIKNDIDSNIDTNIAIQNYIDCLTKTQPYDKDKFKRPTHINDTGNIYVHRLGVIIKQIKMNNYVDIHLPIILSPDPLFSSMIRGNIPTSHVTNEIWKLNGDLGLCSMKNENGFHYPAGFHHVILCTNHGTTHNLSNEIEALLKINQESPSIKFKTYLESQHNIIPDSVAHFMPESRYLKNIPKNIHYFKKWESFYEKILQFYYKTNTIHAPKTGFGKKNGIFGDSDINDVNFDKRNDKQLTHSYSTTNTVVSMNQNSFMVIFNDKSPLITEPNHSKPYGSGHSAAQSYVHMLGIPYKRLYNIITLTNKDIPILDDMIKNTNTFWKENKNKVYCITEFLYRVWTVRNKYIINQNNSTKTYVNNILQFRYNQHKILKDKLETILKECINEYDDTNRDIQTSQKAFVEMYNNVVKIDENLLSKLTLQYELHLHPFQSVGQLHVQIICPELTTFAVDNFFGQSIFVGDTSSDNTHEDFKKFVRENNIVCCQRNSKKKKGGTTGKTGGDIINAIITNNPFSKPLNKYLQNGGKIRTKKDLEKFVIDTYSKNNSLEKKIIKIAKLNSYSLNKKVK